MTDPAGRPEPFPDHFSARAPAYARYRPSYPSGVANHLAGVAPGRGLAWDAGCGSGQFSVLLGDRFERVVATDASEAQLARAATHDRVEYRRALSGESGLPAASVDLATAAQAAHWFDLDPYYAEVRRVARPGGVVALLSYRMPSLDGPADQILSRFHAGVLEPLWPPQRLHVQEAYRSLPFPFAEIDSPSFPPMEAFWTAEEFLGYLGTWSSVRRLEAQGDGGLLEPFRTELAEAWGEGRRPVRWPLAVRAGRV